MRPLPKRRGADPKSRSGPVHWNVVRSHQDVNADAGKYAGREQDLESDDPSSCAKVFPECPSTMGGAELKDSKVPADDPDGGHRPDEADRHPEVHGTPVLMR